MEHAVLPTADMELLTQEPAAALVMLIGQKTVKEFATSVHTNAEMEVNLEVFLSN